MSPDLTIDAVLADPMIRAVMRADRVEPQAFERLLRTAAKDAGRPHLRDGLAPANLVARQARAILGCCRA